jgi:hypothetical protein
MIEKCDKIIDSQMTQSIASLFELIVNLLDIVLIHSKYPFSYKI